MNPIEKTRRKVQNTLRKALHSPASWLRSQVVPGAPLERLGSEYGGWHVVRDQHLDGSVALLCGAGEDVSFDLELQARYGAKVLIVDPTPRAVAHFEGLRSAFGAGQSYAINNSSNTYDFSRLNLSRIAFAPVAVWDSDTVLKFWAPANPEHVSYSAVNLQNTRQSIEVQAESIPTLLSRIETDKVDILKLDVEGAAIAVLNALLASSMRPAQILVEFDEVHFPTRSAIQGVKQMVTQLRDAGYDMVHYDDMANCVFYRPYGERLQ